MELLGLKRSIARVEIDGTPNGTAFLVDYSHVATALHVLAGRPEVDLVFPEWPRRDRKRRGILTWRHPSGADVAVLKLDRDCPEDIRPAPWATTEPSAGDSWISWGFPSQIPHGHTLGDRVNDPSLLIPDLNRRILQLETPAAGYDLRGMSGAPCLIGDSVAGVITHQLQRSLPGRESQVQEPSMEQVWQPSLDTLYALPIKMLADAPITTPGCANAVVQKRGGLAPQNLHYLCDRGDQEFALDDFFSRASQDHFSRPCIMIVHGDSKQAHAAFIHRMREHYLPERLGRLRFNGEIYTPRALNRLIVKRPEDLANRVREKILEGLLIEKDCPNDHALVQTLVEMKINLVAPVFDFSTIFITPAIASDPYWAAAPSRRISILSIEIAGIDPTSLPEFPFSTAPPRIGAGL